MTEVRICENCGNKNPVASLECEMCGYDISFCIPIEDNEADKQIANEYISAEGLWKLTAEDDENIYLLIENEITVGRENCDISDYLNKSDFISRMHCKLYIRENKLYIIDASTNGTYINGNRLEKLKEYELNIGDEIIFADIKFTITK